jgi:hypothetical protein
MAWLVSGKIANSIGVMLKVLPTLVLIKPHRDKRHLGQALSHVRQSLIQVGDYVNQMFEHQGAV